MMENLQARHAQEMIPRLKMEVSYKMDEGYSEDTRSQDGLDSPMGTESANENLLQSQLMSATGLPAAVLALSETEKAGEFASPCP